MVERLNYYWKYSEQNNVEIRKKILFWLANDVKKGAIIENLKRSFNKGDVSKANWKLLF
jgi:hypothetical protein